MSLVQSFIKPIDSLNFPFSQAVVGHTIPGILTRYPVRTVNFSDLSSALRRAKAFKDPVTKYPGMNDENVPGHSLMDRLKNLLNGKQSPAFMHESFRKGYERLTEDLGWRGVRQPRPVPNAGLNPALHGPEVAGVLGAPPGLDL